MPKPWFQVKAQGGGHSGGQGSTEALSTEPLSAEIAIRGIIGDDGLTDADLIGQIDALGKPSAITVRINSIGGDASMGLSVFNYLRGSGAEITVRIDGVAMSSATVIAMAASPGKLIMPANALFMAHKPWVVVAGNADQLRAAAADMDVWTQALVQTYRDRTQMSAEALDAFLAQERIMTAQEAVDLGFADVVEPLAKSAETVAATSLNRVMARALGVPDDVLARVQAIEDAAGQDPAPQDPAPQDPAPQDPQPKQPEARLTLAQQIHASAQAAGLARYATAFLLDKTITSAEAATQVIAQAQEVAELCTLAGLPDLASELINARATREAACDRITAARADAADRHPTDTHRRSAGADKDKHGNPSPGAQAFSTAAIWAARRNQTIPTT